MTQAFQKGERVRDKVAPHNRRLGTVAAVNQAEGDLSDTA
jgi:hypothetical protein